MAATDQKQWGAAIFCTLAVAASVTWIALGGGRDPQPSATPSASAPATRVTTSAPSPATGVQEWPSCSDALPTCVRQEGDQWYVIHDYQGDKRPVSLVTTVVRGNVTYYVVKG